MFGYVDKYVVVFLTGLMISYLLTPMVRRLAERYGVVDLPNERRPHKTPTARGGGLALVIGFHAACLIALALPWPSLAGGLDLHWWGHVALASLVLLTVGLIDDIRGLGPLPKLCGQMLAALLIWFSGAQFGNLFGYLLPPWLDCILVVLWIVAVINAFNLIDGLDGLASGLAIISATGLCGFFIINHLPGNVLVLLALIGASLGFLRYNFHPASIFLGDTGSMFLGFVLAVIALQTFTKSTFLLAVMIPVLVLGIPLYDEILAVWRRSIRGWLNRDNPAAGRKTHGIMRPDLEHLHHRLLKAGLSIRRVAIVLYIGNVGLVCFGLLLVLFQSRAAGIFLIALLAGVYVVMRHLAVIELRDTGTAILSGLARPTHATLQALFYPFWDMVCMSVVLALAMCLFEPAPTFSWHNWFLDLPVWVTPTFSLLALSRAYITVWARARVFDILVLIGTLQLGLLLSLGIALLIDPSESRTWFIRFLVMGGLSHPAMVALRVVYRSLEEMVLHFRIKSEAKADSKRVVLYGAGGRCQLFLRERGFVNSCSYDRRTIVGLIDDERSLQNQWVYGYLVLGGSKDLPRLIARDHINGIIITAALSSEVRTEVQNIAQLKGVSLSEWRFGEEVLHVEALPAEDLPRPAFASPA